MGQIKRIIIEGEKVHNVGYRPFLLRKARRLGIQNYDADNVVEDGQQRVVVSLGGDENQVREFVEFVKANYPSNSKVSDVREAEPLDRVMPIDEYDKVLAAEQQNKIVQTGLEMIEKQDQTIEVLGGRIDHGFEKMDQNFNKMDVKYDKVSDKMDSIDNTLKELTKAILKLAGKSV